MEVLLSKAVTDEKTKARVAVPEVWFCHRCQKIIVDSDRITVVVMPRRMSG
jgi:hypothetical protein